MYARPVTTRVVIVPCTCHIPSLSGTISHDMPGPKPEKARLPPRWFIRLAWIVHRRLYVWTGGRLGLWRPKRRRWGAMRLTTIGRRTGRARAVMLGDRMWSQWRQYDKSLDAYAARRSAETAVVILEPQVPS